MMNKAFRVLIVEDSEDDFLLLVRELRRGGYNPVFERVETLDAMKAALERQTWDMVISDYAMPRFSALAALALLKESGLDLPFIIVSGKIGEDTAVAAMKAGAHDYIMKGNLARLIPAIERELRDAEVRRQRKRTEEQLLQAQKMEAVGRLAGGVAHDFNNMLTAILSYSHLSLNSLDEDNPLRKNIGEVIKAGEKAATLTRQLLAFSRKQVIEPKVLDLNTIVTEMDKMLRRLISENIDPVTVVESALGRVKADAGQIEQVIMNLAVNASDAMPQGGRLTIKTANIDLDEASAGRYEDLQPGRYVMLEVADTGDGMTSEIMSQIFEPFFTTKEQGKGTGLGLSTVYGIVKQNGGYVFVDSEPGMGTTFKIYLPRVKEAVETVISQVSLTRQPHGTETILVVEDEDAVRKLLCKILQKYGYSILEARHGDEALQITECHKGHPIHLMVTDVIMPRMSGIELAQRLVPKCPDMKVLYLSGYMDNTIIHNKTLDQNTAFLQKPFTPNVLLRKVRGILDADRQHEDIR